MAKTFELRALITGIDKLSPMLSTMQKNLKGWKLQAAALGKGGIAMGAGLAAMVGGSLKAFADQEDAATQLKTSMMGAGGAVAAEFGKVNELAVSLGDKLPGTTADFQRMMTTLLRQGVPAQSVLEGVGKATAYLAVQLGMAPEEAALFAAKLQTATGTVNADMLTLMDTIQRVQNLGVNSDDMLQGFSKMAPVMDMIKVHGLAAAQAFAPLIAVAVRSGMAGEAAGNAWRKVFSAGFDAKKMATVNKMMAHKGIKLDFTNGKGEFGGMDNFYAQLAKLKGLSTGGRTTILKELFGDDAETLQAVSIAITQGKDGIEAMRASMAAQADLTTRVNAQLGTLKNLWDAMTGTAINAAAAIGGAFEGEAKGMTDLLGSASSWMSTFAAEHPGIIRGLFGMAAGLTVLKIGALGVARGMAIASAVMNGMTNFNPWLLALKIGFMLLGLAAVYVIDHWEEVSSFFSGLWQGITDGASGLIDFLMGMWAKVKPYIQPIIDFYANTYGAVWQGAKAVAGWAAGTPVQPSAPLNAPPGGGLLNQPQRQQVNGEIKVTFDGAPAGMRVDAGKTSAPGLTLNPDVGYRSAALGLP